MQEGEACGFKYVSSAYEDNAWDHEVKRPLKIEGLGDLKTGDKITAAVSLQIKSSADTINIPEGDAEVFVITLGVSDSAIHLVAGAVASVALLAF